MVKVLGRKSHRPKTSLKYNIQKRVREHKRRCKKEAKKLGLSKRVKKDPGIPNSWPFKAEMLAELERKKEKKDEEMAKKKLEAREKAKTDREALEVAQRQDREEKVAEKRQKRSEDIDKQHRESLRKVLLKSDVLLMVLDARDPLACRCAEVEAWARENSKRLIFVLTKTDLVSPQTTTRWLQWLGQVGPAVAVQAEAGREGIAELLRLLGHQAIPGNAAAALPAATCVGLLGYAGTGKRALSKAIRKEVKGSTKWLQEAIGRLRPQNEQLQDALAAAPGTLHLAMRGALPRLAGNEGSSESSAPGRLATAVQHLIERAGAQALMRRFRLPVFDAAPALLKIFVKDRSLKTKKGREPSTETVAHRLLTELAASPGCVCVPPDVAPAAETSLWTSHGEHRNQLELLLKAQVDLLQSRDAGPAASSLQLASRPSPGPAVNLAKTLEAGEEEEEEVEEAEADEDEMEEDSDEGDEEGEEEEMLTEEGEEEEGTDDDEMEDE